MRKLLFALFKLGCLSVWLAVNVCHASTVENTESIPTFTLWLGHSKIRLPYETSLVRLALDKTKPTYGEYKLTVFTDSLSSPRGLRMIREGHIHMFVSGNREKERYYLRIIDIPIWEGLLGYRKLMIHKDKLPAFAEVRTITDLRKYRAGQGTNWTDILIYKENNIEVATAVSFSSMYGMLNAGRFDFLPLGVNEIGANLQDANIHYPELTVAPNLVIRYPLNIYIQVGVQHKQLASRIEEGLRIAEVDGSWAALKNIYLDHHLQEKTSEKFNVIELNARHEQGWR